MKARKISLSLVLIICMLLSSIGTVSAATFKSDIEGSWAEATLKDWLDKGWLSGYPDGTVRPNHQVTRGEFVSLVNRAFGLAEQAAIQFGDLKKTDWVYDQVAKAVKAGYIKGYEDGTIQAGKNVTREESAVMLANLVKLDTTQGDVLKYQDSGSIAAWSKGAVGAISGKKIMNGYSDGTFKPRASITRVEAVVAIDNALRAAKENAGNRNVSYDKAGSYGPVSGVDSVDGNVTVAVAGVTLQNLVVKGDLILGQGIGDGDVTIKGVTVLGKTIVNGGGENSVHFVNSVLLIIEVNKKEGTVRIVAEGSTTVQTVILKSSAKVEEEGATGSSFSNVQLSAELPENALVTLLGSFSTVDILAKSIKVEIPKGSIEELNIDKTASGISVDVKADAKIVSLVLNAVTKMLGLGKIEKATINDNAGGSSFEQKPNTVEGNQKNNLIAPTPTPSVNNGQGESGSAAPTGPTVPAAPNLTLAAGSSADRTKLTGLTTGVVYEYVLDSNADIEGSTGAWLSAVAFTASGDVEDNINPGANTYIHVRIKAASSTPASSIKHIEITAVNVSAASAPTSGATYDVAAGTLEFGAIYEYRLNGGAYTAAASGVVFIPGTVEIRVKATPTKPASLPEAIGTIAPAASAPNASLEAGTDEDRTKLAGLVNGIKYEYVLDSNPSLAGNAAAWTSAVAFTANGTVQDNIDPGVSEYIHVRTAITSTVFASEVKDLAILAANVSAAAAPTSNVAYDVAAGTVTGLNSIYEYSLNGGAYSTTATGVVFVEGTIEVRKIATATKPASLPQTVGTIEAAANAPSVSMTAGTLADRMKLAGLANGIKYEYVLDSNASLAGNAAAWTSAVSFPASGTVQDNIDPGENEYIHVRTAITSTAFASQVKDLPILAANVSAAAAPTSNVTYNVAARTVTGLSTVYEYSLNGGAYNSSTTTSVPFVPGAVEVRRKATALKPASLPQTIGTIANIAAAPNVTADFSGGQSAVKLVNATTAMEYSRNGGTDWSPVTVDIAIDASIAPNNDLRVRVAATATALASESTDQINIALSLAGVGVNIASGQITGTTGLMQYSLNSTNGADGTWMDASAANTSVSFSAGTVYVREKAQITNFRLVKTIDAAASAPNVSLAAGTLADRTKLTGLANGVVYEYVLDGNAILAGNASAWDSAASFTASGTVQDNIDPGLNTYAHVRVKTTVQELPSAVQELTIAAANVSPASAPTSNVTYDVAAGTVTGLNSIYEYSLNSGAYSVTATGVVFVEGTIEVRKIATATKPASLPQTVGTIEAAANAPSVSLAAGTAADRTKLAGLANGIKYEYVLDSNASLAGNAAAWTSAVSFPASGTVQDNIDPGENEYIHVRTANTSTAFASQVKDLPILAANVSAAAAPTSNVTYNVAARTVTGLSTVYEYSLNGGAYNSSTTTSVPFVPGAVEVRRKATALKPASLPQTIGTIANIAAAPNVTADFTNGQSLLKLFNATTAMEYSRNGGTDWSPVTVDIAIDASSAPNNDLRVRVAATATALASESTDQINIALSLAGVGVNIASGQITGTTGLMQYSLNSTNGVDGTWMDASAANTSVSFSAGTVYVREKEQITNFRLVKTIDAAASAPNVSLAAGTLADRTKLTGLANGVVYEYVLDGNAILAGNASAWNSAASFTASGTVEDNIDPGLNLYIHVRAAITASEFASEVKDIAILANNVSVASAPTSSVTYNVAAGTITGLGTIYEYSLNGGDYATLATGVAFVEGAVLVRKKSTTTKPASLPESIGTIATAAQPNFVLAPGTQADRTKLTGLSNGVVYEYVLDDNASLAGNAVAWNTADSFIVNGTEQDNINPGTSSYIHIRVKISGLAFASGTATAAIVPDKVSPANYVSLVTYNILAGTVSNLNNQYEYSLNGGAYSSLTSGVVFEAGSVKVRAKETATKPNSVPELVGTIAAVAPAPTSGVTYNIVLGQVNGLNNIYEYRLNGGTYSTEASNLTFIGGAVEVRLKATATALPSEAETIGTIAAASKPIVDLAEGSNPDRTKLTGLSNGITYEYVMDNQAVLPGDDAAWSNAQSFLANGTEYDNINPDTNEYIHARVKISGLAFASDAADVAIVAGKVSAASAPNSGVTYDIANGSLSGLGNLYEYSLNDDSYQTLDSGVTFQAGAVKVRIIATATKPASLPQTLGTIAPAAAAPVSGVSYNIAAGTVTGLASQYEYSLGGGAYSIQSSGVAFIAGEVKVRIRATASVLPSQPEIIATIAPAAPAPVSGINYSVASRTILGIGIYELRPGGGSYVTQLTNVPFVPGDVKVRIPATATVLASEAEVIGTILPIAAAPIFTINAGSGGNLILNGSTTAMEYSTNQGATYTAIPSNNWQFPNTWTYLRVRVKATDTQLESYPNILFEVPYEG